LISHEPYEVDYFAKKHRIDKDKAQLIIQRHGPSLEVCDRAANSK